jgi:OFA family oxalate/formate antiporter-like MFS transporter
VKRYCILIACVLMLLFLGTNQAWSVFVEPLRAEFGYSAFQMQLVFNTVIVSFCVTVIAAGRLHDRLGPRPLAMASAVLIGLAWTLAWIFTGVYVVLWFAIGVLAGTGAAVGYVCPIATAIKWFPNHQGLVSGLTAAGFAGGPILLSFIAETFMHRGAGPGDVFGLVALIYTSAVLLAGMMLVLPPGQSEHEDVIQFRRRTLLRDRRFRALFVGMFTGTLPFLLVMGNAKPLALDFGFPEALAAMAVPVLAVGNAFGRGFWGLVIDRVGPRGSMLGAQGIMILAMVVLITWGDRTAAAFFGSTLAIGFCYGSNFAIYPATVSRLYGVHLFGSVYPFIVASQGISSLASTVNGLLKDATGSNLPGLGFALTVAVAGSVTCVVLTRPVAEEKTFPAAMWGRIGVLPQPTGQEPCSVDKPVPGADLTVEVEGVGRAAELA